MRKLIEFDQKFVVECDKSGCGYKIPWTDGDLIEVTKEYINKPCPECGENLCTQEDYDNWVSMIKATNWVNK